MPPFQVIRQPFGVTTYGSTVIRVEPDVASIHFAISKTEKHPKEAFRVVRDISRKAADFLQHANYKKETSSSRISLSQAWDFMGGTRNFLGYEARASFHTMLFDLDQLEHFLVGLVDSGVNEIIDVNFQTSRLREVRADARRKAVEAATSKAENYCLAAQIKLGGVIHVEDVNPDTGDFLGQRYTAHAMSQNMINMVGSEEMEDLQAFNPGGISVTAAVLVAFNIAHE